MQSMQRFFISTYDGLGCISVSGVSHVEKDGDVVTFLNEAGEIIGGLHLKHAMFLSEGISNPPIRKDNGSDPTDYIG